MLSDILFRLTLLILLGPGEFELLKNQDKKMLEKVYNFYKDKIFNYFMIKIYNNREIAEDLTQETFYSVIKSVTTLKNLKNMDGWVLSIASRKLRDYQRGLFREKKYTTIIKEPIPKSDDILESLDLKQKALLLSMAKKNLNPFYRQVYKMKYIEKKKIKEIADAFDKTEKAIESIITRINSSLKKDMKKIAKNFFKENNDV